MGTAPSEACPGRGRTVAAVVLPGARWSPSELRLRVEGAPLATATSTWFWQSDHLLSVVSERVARVSDVANSRFTGRLSALYRPGKCRLWSVTTPRRSYSVPSGRFATRCAAKHAKWPICPTSRTRPGNRIGGLRGRSGTPKPAKWPIQSGRSHLTAPHDVAQTCQVANSPNLATASSTWRRTHVQGPQDPHVSMAVTSPSGVGRPRRTAVQQRGRPHRASRALQINEVATLDVCGLDVAVANSNRVVAGLEIEMHLTEVVGLTGSFVTATDGDPLFGDRLSRLRLVNPKCEHEDSLSATNVPDRRRRTLMTG